MYWTSRFCFLNEDVDVSANQIERFSRNGDLLDYMCNFRYIYIYVYYNVSCISVLSMCACMNM